MKLPLQERLRVQAEGLRRQQFKTMDEAELKEYRELVKDADEVVVAHEVELIDFTEQYERDGKKIRYFGTQESWKKWCLEQGIPLVN